MQERGLQPSFDDTIFAWATAPGRAGVSVLRISGPKALNALESLKAKRPAPRHAALVTLTHPESGHVIDTCLCLYFEGPASFTGEDVVELHTHGSLAIQNLLLDALMSLPYARHAEAGEFSKRAFYNQKFDLLEAEGLADLIDADTTAQHLQAIRQMGGDASRIYDELRSQTIHAMAMFEAYIDFPDEEIPESVTQDGHASIEKIIDEIELLLDDKGVGETIRRGVTATIIGPPNVGKSSLLNRLAKRDVAIVSDIAGTTRDMIEVHLDIDGHAVTLIDTAGLRETEEAIEKEGIKRAKERAKHSDITLLMVENISDAEEYINNIDASGDNTLLILNKTDLSDHDPDSLDSGLKTIAISCKTGDGFDALIESLKTHIRHRISADANPVITRARHREQLQSALSRLRDSVSQDELELKCEDLRSAAFAIGNITGKIDLDEVLDVIFHSFCIGK
ncbi:MAG: tRNA uridine-5-carboxymethylaminomethyl(34) synthesis GTPase MnmE [Rickettsiales bacterium]|nr:tRNA uridine-5-carboxymethylaminomethyl(34) synthesis GTPase MnmE [Rickettsiales bacterium]